jgi:peptidyl-tRNA hydrolase, PTH1 family
MAWRRRGATERRGTPSDLLVVGLGNPGAEYEGTRHNVGSEVVRILATRHGGRLKVEPRQRALLCEVRIGGALVALAVPTTFMNESGAALRGLLERTGIADLSQLLVVHDEIDFEAGRLQLKAGGGSAGHNGLRSITSALKSSDYLRLRIGVGRPPSKEAGANWVLSRPRGSDGEAIAIALERAAVGIETLATAGLERAMGELNTRG